jgi:hypothetical protein
MPSHDHPAATLRGRLSECRVLEGLVAEVWEGRSRVLVVRGEAGIGKTALLEYLAAAAAVSGCRVMWTAGIESDVELAYAGVHQFCGPVLGGRGQLPVPQRGALDVAFGLEVGAAPDRFMVGLAVLGLLADAAEQQPQVFLVDDAQWLDQVSAQTLAFVARRLLAERVVMVFAVRETGVAPVLSGLPELMVGGLADEDARALLDVVLQGPVDEGVRERIVAETRGNPLALIELPHGLTPAQLAGGFGLPDTLSLAGGIERRFLERLRPLPGDTRRLLLAAAADPVGDATMLWSAAALMGITIDAAGPAEAAGLVEISSQVRFRHPLVRSAVYRSASAGERREIHRVLATVTDPVLDPDRRAWHRAQAAMGPDEEVAAELEGSAQRAQARGGAAATAAFLERAAALTPDPERRARRGLEAATAKRHAGALSAALAELEFGVFRCCRGPARGRRVRGC